MLTQPGQPPTMEQELYRVNAIINGSLTPAEIPKCVRDLKIREGEGGRKVLEIAVDVDVGDRARLDASLQGLHQLESVLRAATTNVK